MKTVHLIDERTKAIVEPPVEQKPRKTDNDRSIDGALTIRLPSAGTTSIVGNAVVRAVAVASREGAAEGVFYVVGPKA